MVALRAVPQQCLDQPHAAFGGGDHQDCPPLAFLLVRISSTPQQRVDELLVASIGGSHEKREATHGDVLPCIFERRVDPPAAVKPRHYRRLVASLGCSHDPRWNRVAR